jgi:hypothetical protein
MDEEPALRTRLISNGKAAVGMMFYDLVLGPHISTHGVHAQVEQTTGGNALLGLSDESVGGEPVSMLEHLDPDNDRKRAFGRKGAEVPVDQAATALGSALRELLDRDSRDVKPDEVKSRLNEGNVVAPVPTADIETRGVSDVSIGYGSEDVLNEGDWRVPRIAASRELGIPASGDTQIRSSCVRQ